MLIFGFDNNVVMFLAKTRIFIEFSLLSTFSITQVRYQLHIDIHDVANSSYDHQHNKGEIIQRQKFMLHVKNARVLIKVAWLPCHSGLI